MGYASVPSGEAERRLRSRWKPASLLYVELDEGNGGVVINISETGVAIHAAQTVLQSAVSSVRFKLPPSREKIVARGQIAWKGDTRKELGVRFVDLPPAVQLAIRKWIQADSVPRRLPENVRPFPLSKVRPISPPLAAAQATTAAAPQAPGNDAAPARYPISTAMAFAMREAKEAERAATPPASLAARATIPAVPAAPVRTARYEAIPKPVSRTAPTSPAAASLEKPAAATKLAAPARPLIGSVLPLGYESQATSETVPRYEHALGNSRLTWGRRILLAAVLTAISFAFGLAVGGQDLSAIAELLRAGSARTWSAVVGYFAPGHGEVVIMETAPNAAISTGALSPAEKAVKSEAAASGVDPAPKPSVTQDEPKRSAALLSPATSQSPTKRTRNELVGPAHSKGSSDIPHLRDSKASPLMPGPARTAPDPAMTPAGGVERNSKQQQPIAPSSTAVSGTVVVHSRLRTIRVPSDLHLPNAQPGEGLQVGELISGEPPAYPPDALRDGIEGTVSLRAVIGRDGTVASVDVMKGPALLASPSLAVVRGWRYEPTSLGGQPVEWEEDITLVFRLQNSSTPSN